MKLSFMLTFAAVYALSTLIQYVASHSHINDFGIDIGKETIFKTKRAIAYRNKQRRHNDEDKTKTKFIVHIDNSKITSEEFVNHLHTYFNSESISESTIGIQSTTSSQNIKKRVVETHPIHHVLDGIIVSGLLIDEIKQLPHVVRVARETIVRVNAAPTLPWGLDRVNQDSLPLDGIYSSNYTGKDIDVYVVDTGIDTLHSEFQNLAGSSRIVKNIYNAFINPRTNPSTNTDDVGHGTHVSGTIGGLTVGLSPNANLYGLKILNSDGEGSSADVVLALDYVASQVKSSGRRSLVSMSLGGPCEDDTACSSDSVVVAVEHLSSLGIMVSVAAGNDGCNACYGSPNSAPHVITGKYFHLYIHIFI